MALSSRIFICHDDFNVVALIGIILFIGIVKKNAIMMIDFALEAERNGGKSPIEAIYQACLLRFRPIMMTTMAALFGGLPLALGPASVLNSAGPSASPSSAASSSAKSLLSTPRPSSILFFDRLANRLRGGRRRNRPRPNSIASPLPSSGGRSMNLSAPFIKRPAATTLLTAALALSGVLAFKFLPVAPLPPGRTPHH